MTKAKEATKREEPKVEPIEEPIEEPMITGEEAEPETALANPSDVMAYLNKKADEIYQPGFAVIEVNHKTGTFTAEGFGTADEITGIVLSTEETRALWAFGTEQEQASIRDWVGPIPLCSSRGENALNYKGELSKLLDNEAPDLVRTIIKPILDTDCKCGSDRKPVCQWAQFGASGGGRGQACKKCIRLLIWNPGSGTAGILVASPTSLKAWRNYRAMIPNGHFSSIVTSFTLNKMERGQYRWSILRPKSGDPVSPEMIQPLGKIIKYQGKAVMEIEAMIAEFLRLDLVEEEMYETNGSAVGDTEVDDF